MTRQNGCADAEHHVLYHSRRPARQGRQEKCHTAKSTTIFDFLEFVEDFCPFKGCDANGNVPWKPFPVKGTMHNAGSEVAVCITRPRIPHWESSFTVKYDEKRQVPQDAVVKLVETAGRNTVCAIGARRRRAVSAVSSSAKSKS